MRRVSVFAIVGICVLVNPLNPQSDVSAGHQTAGSVGSSLRAMIIDVQIVEIKPDGKHERPLDMFGAANDVAARVQELESAGKIDLIDRFRLTTIENQKALVQLGRTAAVVTGRAFGGRGGPVRDSYQQQQFGTLVSAIGKLDGNAVILELTIEKSQLERRDAADELQPGADIAPPATQTLTSQATVRIANGATVLVGGMQTTIGSKARQHFVLATARILPPAAESKVRVRPAAAEKQTRIVPLNTVSAPEAAKVVKEVYRDLIDQFNIGVDSESNAIIIHASKKQLEAIEALLRKLDDQVGKVAN